MSSLYGLLNLGNTCYINVNIQLFITLFELNNILENFFDNDNIDDKTLLFSYIHILKRLKKIKADEQNELNDNNSEKIYTRKIKLTSFINKFRQIFSQVSFNQQDCMEGLNFIIINFHQTLSKINKIDDYNLLLKNIKYNDLIKNICINKFKLDLKNDFSILFNYFYSYLLTTIKCSKCNHTINKIDMYIELSINIDKINLQNNDLTKLLDNYFLPEKLLDYKCDNCKETFHCVKKYTLLNIPKYFIIQIKRFEFNMQNMQSIKLNHQINFPLSINFSKYTLDNNINENINNNFNYKLDSIIYHLGPSLHNGHYTSVHNINNQWFYADDSEIDIINKNEILNENNTKNSYILIYKNIK